MKIENYIKMIKMCGFDFAYNSMDNIIHGYINEGEKHSLYFEQETKNLKEGLKAFLVNILDIKDTDVYNYVALPKECFGVKPVMEDDVIKLIPAYYNPLRLPELDISLDVADYVTQQINKNNEYLNEDMLEQYKNWLVNIKNKDHILIYEFLRRFDQLLLINSFNSEMAIGCLDNYNNTKSEMHNLPKDQDKLLHLEELFLQYLGE